MNFKASFFGSWLFLKLRTNLNVALKNQPLFCMKKHLFLAIFLIFSLPFFALDFSENFTQFYQSDFSEENRQLFYNNLLELEKTDDISFLLFDNEEAQETFSKIQELSNHPLNQEEKTELTTLCFHFMELYHDSHKILNT